MAHATANKNCIKVKATSHPTYKTQPLAKGHMPIRRVPLAEKACPLRPGPKGQAAEPRTGPPTPTEKNAFQTASCGRWPRCGRAQSLSRLYTVGNWEVGWGHRPCVIATANRHQAPGAEVSPVALTLDRGRLRRPELLPRASDMVPHWPSMSFGFWKSPVSHTTTILVLALVLVQCISHHRTNHQPSCSCRRAGGWCGGGRCTGGEG